LVGISSGINLLSFSQLKQTAGLYIAAVWLTS